MLTNKKNQEFLIRNAADFVLYFPQLTLMYIGISEATIYDPDTGTLSNIGNSSCSHKGAGCALYYSPIHMNRPTVFIGGSSVSPYENCSEVLDYTTTNSTWEKRKCQTDRTKQLLQVVLKNISLYLQFQIFQ